VPEETQIEDRGKRQYGLQATPITTKNSQKHEKPGFYRFNFCARICFIAALLVGIFAHGFMLTNEFLNHDDMVVSFGGSNGLYNGRWMTGPMGNLIYVNSPWFNGLILIVFLAIAAAIITDMFEIKNKLIAVCVGASFVTFPSVISTLLYKFMSPAYAMGILLSVIAAWLPVRKKRWWHTQLAVLVIIVSMGFYQAYFSLTASLLLVALIRETSLSDIPEKAALKHGLVSLTILIEGMVGYLLTERLLLKMTGVTLASYNDMDTMGKLDFAKLPEQVKNAYQMFFTFYQGTFSDNSVAKATDIGLTLLFAVIAVFYCEQCIKRKRHLNISFVMLYVILFPLSSNLTWLYGSQFVHQLMFHANVMLPIFILISAEDIFACFANNGSIFKGNLVVRLCGVFVCVLTMTNVYRANAIYTEQERSFRQAVLYCNRLGLV